MRLLLILRALIIWLIASIGIIISIVVGFVSAIFLPQKIYFWSLMESMDQTANAVIGGNIDQTISGRCGKRLPNCKVCSKLCYLLGILDRKTHCKDSIDHDED